jgi:integrase
MARIERNERRKYGKQWEVHWSWREGKGDSRVRRFGQRAFATKAEAEAFEADLRLKMSSGFVPNVAAGRLTFEEYAETWLSSLADLKPRTIEGYKQRLDCHVLPVFGAMEVRDIRRTHCEDYLRVLSAKGLTPPSIKHAYDPLKWVLQRAVQDDALVRNVAAGIRLPTDRSTGRSKPPAHFLSSEQVELLARELDAVPPYGLLVRFMAYTGLRAGEVAGLNVADVATGRVNVHRTREKIKGGWREGTPKSEKSKRLVPMPGWLREDMRDYLANGHPRGSEPDAPLWPGRHRYPDSVKLGELDWSEPWERGCFAKAAFRPALRRAGLPATVRLHDLRHTFASICAREGMTREMVMELMGHSSVVMTADYTHLFTSDKDAAVERLARPTLGALGDNVRRLA